MWVSTRISELFPGVWIGIHSAIQLFEVAYKVQEAISTGSFRQVSGAPSVFDIKPDQPWKFDYVELEFEEIQTGNHYFLRYDSSHGGIWRRSDVTRPPDTDS